LDRSPGVGGWQPPVTAAQLQVDPASGHVCNMRHVVGPGQVALLARRHLPALPPVDRLCCRRCHHQYNGNGNGE